MRRRLPFAGVRVIDLTMWWAGPLATAILADFGAQVLKVESVQRIDGWRRYSQNPDHPWERSPLANWVNRNKLGITLDLARPEGVALLKRLAAIADVVAENYSARVMENFGLTYEALRRLNPSLVMLSLPAFGLTGPWRDHVGFAFTIEEMAGLPALTGYPDGPPMLTGSVLADPVGGLHGALALMLALRHRRRTGQGQHIDLSQLEALTCFLGGELLECSRSGRAPPRRGNRSLWMAPHGVYPCRGEDQWVAIAIADDAMWEALVRALGEPAWAADPLLATAEGRRRHEEDIARNLTEWTRQRALQEAMNVLQAAGVAAGAVQGPAELSADPHLGERRIFELVERAYVGRHPHMGNALRLSRTPGHIRRAAPTLGQHNRQVLGELLGLPAAALRRLESARVIGTEPLQ